MYTFNEIKLSHKWKGQKINLSIKLNNNNLGDLQRLQKIYIYVNSCCETQRKKNNKEAKSNNFLFQ